MDFTRTPNLPKNQVSHGELMKAYESHDTAIDGEFNMFNMFQTKKIKKFLSMRT